MYSVDALLRKASGNNASLSLAHIQSFSFAEIRRRFEHKLTWGEAHYLFREAQAQLKQNKLLQAKIFTQSNPQLPRAIRSGIKENIASHDYSSMFGSRSSSFVKSGSVASMFSPAGYLTELYREAKDLHPEESAYHLAKRRPDLAQLMLSQENMDEEISTLSLSNDILLAHVEKNAEKSDDELLEYFSTDRFSSATPYHQPYESLRQSVLSLDPELDALASSPDILRRADPASLLSILTNISPTLHDILVEDITDENAEELYERNFSLPITHFSSTQKIQDYYNLTAEEKTAFLGYLDRVVFANDTPQKEGPVYTGGILTTTVYGENDSVTKYQLRMGETKNPYQFNYIELVPLGDLRFDVRFNVTETRETQTDFSIRTEPGGGILWSESEFVPEANIHTHRQIKLTQDQVDSGVTIGLWRKEPSTSTYWWCSQSFTIKKLSLSAYMLNLNKAIRLCRATGISAEQLENLAYSVGLDGKINDTVISLLFTAIYFRQKYNTTLDDALVLAGAGISQFAGSADFSHFDQIFNNPVLSGEWFSADGSNIDLSPEASDDVVARDSLLRGLSVTRSELHQLGLIAGLISVEETQLPLSLANISALYRLSLVASLNNLTVNELYLLFTVSPSLDTTSADFVHHIHQLSHWMDDANITAAHVWMLTTRDVGETLTPEMQTLRNTLAGTVSEADIAAAPDEDAQRRLIAPYIASSLGLSSPDMAACVVRWCEHAGYFTLSNLLGLLLQQTLDNDEESTLAGYLHLLAQYSLTVQALSLSYAEVEALSGIPGARQLLPNTTQGNTLAWIISLHYFHQWLNTLGRESSAVLDALNQSELTTTLMASAMGQDETVLNQALRCVREGDDDNTLLSDWQTIYQILQWVNVAAALNTMPLVVKQLVDIRLSGEEAERPAWNEWKNLSRSLEAALSPRKALELSAYTAGRLSDLLCYWFLANVDTEWGSMSSRDDLYNYFLIDNQVSSSVTTTRLAEAIASVQLYINRALNRSEPDVQADVATRQFFIDWELNSRYSTWSGISRLVYYPENYVDPLQRIGQTSMMDDLLQSVNQNQLNSDTVNDAFNSYLASFETVADLKTVSAYHDNVNSDTGKTYFVGRGREAVPEYWWRNVDMSLFRDGKMPASAWSEWVKITTPVNAWNDMVRPVMFRDRLNLVWVEKEEITEGTDKPVTTYRYNLKLSFLRHDGNWSAPWSYNITAQITQCLNKGSGISLGASHFIKDKQLIVSVYVLKNDYSEITEQTADVAMLTIDYEGNCEVVPKSRQENYDAMRFTFDYLSANKIIKRACYRFSIDYEYPASLSLSNSADNEQIIIMSTPGIGSITNNDNSIKINNAGFTLKYSGGNRDRRGQVAAMKYAGEFGDVFLIDKYQEYDLAKTKGPVYSAYNTTQKKLAWYQHRSNALTKFIGFSYFDLQGGNDENLWFSFPYQSLNHGVADWEGNFKTIIGGIYAGATDPLELLTEGMTEDEIMQIVSQWMVYTPYYSLAKLQIDTSLNLPGISMELSYDGGTDILTGDKNLDGSPEGHLDHTEYVFTSHEIPFSKLAFKNNQASISVTFKSVAKNGLLETESQGELTVRKVDYSPEKILCIFETDTGVQYIQSGVYRIRLNTQLAPQLISRAHAGNDSILSMETQLLHESQPGNGCYISLTLPPYSTDEHGTSASVSILLTSVENTSTAAGAQVFWRGQLLPSAQTVTLFVPVSQTAGGDPVQFPENPKTGVFVQMACQKGTFTAGVLKALNDDSSVLNAFIKDAQFNPQRDPNVFPLKDTTAPLDFNSASALYYWELFYYVPMMCFRRFLDENKFSEARAWLNYIWDPNGYIVNGDPALWEWNCRPLEEAISRNENPLDLTDPDAVAQNDPTHYKIATFMAFIEMLVTRGDMCYRELTRDALSEARMWYVYALELMGDEPQDYRSTSWNSPSLQDAVSDTLALSLPERTGMHSVDNEEIDTRTANSLTALFLPEYNPALTEMWATLRLRLYNLRNNLSIDGQPLSLAIYAEQVDPKALQTSLVQASQGMPALPASALPLYRFPVMLERARNLVGQLTQFGSSLLNMVEHQDSEELNSLLLQQGLELAAQSLRLQQSAIDEVDADITALRESRSGAQARLDKYTALYNENISRGEYQAMDLADKASSANLSSQIVAMVGGAADMVPNIFGLAAGGAKWGAVAHASSLVDSLKSSVYQISADKISRAENYRRRREEWEIQRDNAQHEVDQIDAQLVGLALRREAALMQLEYQKTQQGHTLAQLEFMQRKFTNQALYNWMRGKLSAIYYQFFDIAQSCCLMAQETLRRDLNDNALTFIRGSAWNGATAGFMAGETLLLNLAEMEKAWTERDTRALEVTRTVSLAEVYAALKESEEGQADGAFAFTDAIAGILQNSAARRYGNGGNEVKQDADGELTASVKLSDLNISADYKNSLGKNRRIKQISVTLPALVGPYENVRAVLSYGGSVVIPRGCNAIAISHGMNDNGQFQLDFNDTRYLPFEGIPVDDTGILTVSFPDAKTGQKALLESLNDIILHIRYTIQS